MPKKEKKELPPPSEATREVQIDGGYCFYPGPHTNVSIAGLGFFTRDVLVKIEPESRERFADAIERGKLRRTFVVSSEAAEPTEGASDESSPASEDQPGLTSEGQ